MKALENSKAYRSRSIRLVMLMLLLCALSAAQEKDPSTASSPATASTSSAQSSDTKAAAQAAPALVVTETEEGVTYGEYQVKQSVEFGGHIADFNGSRSLWSQYVNLDSGPRLLEQSLQIRAPKHNGFLFDELSMNSFGYGGDPNNATRLRMMKGRWYDFNAQFRCDRAFFDYDLLANPLNPTSGSTPTVPYPFSPHLSELIRRMQDYRLDLLPASRFRFRLGYSNNVNEGPAFSTIHEGTETTLLQPTRRRTDSYSGGVSVRLLPRTSLNYDQFWTNFKDDTSWTLSSLLRLPTTGGILIDPGIVLNSPAGQPCTPVFSAPNVLNPACNGYKGFSRTNIVRNSYPTEQFSFQSNYWRRVDMSARISYTGADSDRNLFNELFTGLTSRNRLASQLLTGPSFAQRVSVDADYGLTLTVTERLHLVDTFRWADFRTPSMWAESQTNLYAATLTAAPNPFNPATCPAPFTAAACPQHNISSGPDLQTDLWIKYLGQDTKTNTFEAEYDFTHSLRARLGYRFERREITLRSLDNSIQTFFPGPTAALARRGSCAAPNGTVANGICTATVVTPDGDFTEINAHSGLFGISYRPSERFRASFDTELLSADNTFTRITPRNMQIYKMRSAFKPVSWTNLAMALNLNEKRNPEAEVQNHQHHRTYSFDAGFNKWQRMTLDLNYAFDDVFSSTNICFVSTPAPVNNPRCTLAPTFLSGISTYSDEVHTGGFITTFKPTKRVDAGLGYTLVSSVGKTLILNPNAPLGPLSYNYHLPTATLAVVLNKNLSFRSGWNFYDYNEKSDPGPTLPRDFRGNVVTIGLRYEQ